MYPSWMSEASFYDFLERIDMDLAEAMRQEGCGCAGVLHRASYPRKPRGGPRDLGSGYDRRLSFCCARRDCRRRQTPPSVRFLGRKVYLGAVVVLVSAMRHGTTPARVARIEELVGVSRRTLARVVAGGVCDEPFLAGSGGPFRHAGECGAAAAVAARALRRRRARAPGRRAAVSRAGHDRIGARRHGFLRVAAGPQKMRLAAVERAFVGCGRPDEHRDGRATQADDPRALGAAALLRGGAAARIAARTGRATRRARAARREQVASPGDGGADALRRVDDRALVLPGEERRGGSGRSAAQASAHGQRPAAGGGRAAAPGDPRATRGAHNSWTVQLQHDNLRVLVERTPALGPLPSYATLRRYSKGGEEQKLLLERLMRRREALVRKALRHAGFGDELAFSAKIEARETGFFAGIAKASRYSVPSHLAKSPRFHVKLTWPMKVAGPLCIGRSRSSGLGLFAAVIA